MSLTRRFRRKQPGETASAEKQHPGGGFDLRGVRLTDLESVSLDAEEDTVTVSFTIPVGNGETVAEYEETFEVTEHPHLSNAATALARVLVDMVRGRPDEFEGRDPPCLTCTGNCCGRHFGSVRITMADVTRMKDAGIDVSDETISFYKTEIFSGYVGEFKLVEYDGPDATEDEDCCPHLTREGCSIYHHRPLVCREYSAWTCDIYAEDEEKIEKRRLPIVKEVPDGSAAVE